MKFGIWGLHQILCNFSPYQSNTTQTLHDAQIKLLKKELSYKELVYDIKHISD
jgi:hypothetical protein